jgi:hypothetical protein
MPRYEIDSWPISVAYGYDEPLDHVFLSVIDKRLEYSSTASAEVNSITSKVGIHDGGGSYFNLHTGEFGFGFKVSHATMRTYLLRYGVTDKSIDDIFNYQKTYRKTNETGVKDSNNKKVSNESMMNTLGKKTIEKCSKCSNKTSLVCANCHLTHYCNKKCQTNAWPIHKFICASLPFPEKKLKTKSVYGMLLPENSDKLVLVSVEINFVKIDGLNYERQITGDLLGNGYLDQRYVGLNFRIGENLKNTLMIQFRDGFGSDGSQTNKTVEKLTKNRSPHDWRGPILVTKFEGLDIFSNSIFLDIEESDIQDIIDYFLYYGL